VIQAAVQRVEIAVVILNYRTPELALDCLASLEGELGGAWAAAIVVDNASGDGSADRLDRELRARGWRWARVVRSATNAGFSAGNNRGIASIDEPHHQKIQQQCRRGS
jgi:GT2 family glycosyltransferase